MFRPCNARRLPRGMLGETARRAPQFGLTVLELLIAISIMVIIIGTLGALAKAVQTSSDYSEGRGETTQHARVTLERITRAVQKATANEQFPGFIVVAEVVDGWRFPDTLVVWLPEQNASDSEGLPRFNELVVYCPAVSPANRLMELRFPGDTRTVPAAADLVAWASELAHLKSSPDTRRTLLTDLLRRASVYSVASPPDPNLSGPLRGAVRFEPVYRPSLEQWDAYKNTGVPTWDELPWVQGIQGSQTGLRQAWVRIELQLVARTAASRADPSGQQAVAFFDSGALYYEMHR